MSAAVDKLVAAGMSPAEARRKADWLAAPDGGYAFFVPGRIEFLGKHTDYAGGRSLVCAVERGICLKVMPRRDSVLRIVLEDGRTEEFVLAADLQPRAGHWANYPMTVARRVARNFPGKLVGGEIEIRSDLPQAAGMSSSSAIVVGIFGALSALNQLDERKEYRENIGTIDDLAGYLGTIENGQTFKSLAGDKGVGTFGGSQDHTAILSGQADTLQQYSFCPVRHERSIALPKDYAFAIGVSGVAAEKTGGALEKYNRASRLTGDMLRLWRQGSGRDDATLAAAACSSADAPRRIREILRRQPTDAGDLVDRFDQFVEESFEIIPAVGDALAKGKASEIGALVDRSQWLTEHKLKNQVPETVYLAKTARELGAAAASAFGAGFGGSVWVLVPETIAAEFVDRWKSRYFDAYPGLAPEFFITRAGPGYLRIR